MEMARLANRLTPGAAPSPREARAAILILVSTLTLAACTRAVCPDGMSPDARRSKPGAVTFCVSRAESSRAVWIELHPGGKVRRQVCPFVGGRPAGAYTAFHPSGARWIEGRYESGQKTGRWTQWSPDGHMVAEGQYRDGQLVEGAPVGFPASCESVTW